MVWLRQITLTLPLFIHTEFCKLVVRWVYEFTGLDYWTGHLKNVVLHHFESR